jgi:hypothetical protein
VLGDPTNGARCGVVANGGAMKITGAYIADIFTRGEDTQAICAWDMNPGMWIEDCYLEAAGQSIMLGGGDSSSEARMPRDVTIKGCTLTKNPAWFEAARHIQIKTALEFKACIGVTVDNCVLEYAGTSAGQGGYLIVATVRNQDGHAPWSAIKNVLITNCRGGKAGGIVTLLGQDNNYPSGVLDGFQLRASSFTEIDPKGITGGAGRLFTFDRSPAHVTIAGVSVVGQNIAAKGYFSGQPPTKLTIINVTLPPATYGWKIDAGGMGVAALRAYAPDAIFDNTL